MAIKFAARNEKEMVGINKGRKTMFEVGVFGLVVADIANLPLGVVFF